MPEGEMAPSVFLFNQTGSAAAPAEKRVDTQAELIDRACAGDEDAFGEIYGTFAPLVHGILLARVPYDEVKDLVQEVFLAAYKNLHALRDKNAIGGWLAKIARNHSVEYYRRMKPTEELPDDLKSRRNVSTEAAEILRAIRTLPENYRETLILRLVEGMSGIEIAERTGLTPDSVRVNLHRGMDQLRKKLGIAR